MNLGDLQTYVCTRLDIDATQSAIVTQITQVLNAENYRLHSELELDINVATVAVTGNTNTATLATDIQKMKAVINGAWDMTSIDEYAFARRLAETAAGTAQAVSNPPIEFLFRRPNIIMVWPTPTANTTLSYTYVQRPTAMASAGDPPGALPVEWHDYLAEIATWRIALTEGETAVADDASRIAQQLYQRMMAATNVQPGMVNESRVILRYYG